jgi:8-oxo-dGTP diphosphatase
MIDVTCAIIRNDNDEVLVVQRGEKSDHPFKWEFPGGKTVAGESYEECIVREIYEELGVDIVICSRLDDVEYDYGNKQIKLIPFICDTLVEIPVLTEHISFRWVPPHDLDEIDFCEADTIVAEAYSVTAGIFSNGQETKHEESDTSQVDESGLKQIINNMMSMKEADWLSDSALENPAIFRKLLEYSLSNDRKLAFRASWTLTKVCDKFPEIIYPHLSQIVEYLPDVDNESVERSFLRILSLSDVGRLKEKHHGLLADYCFAELNSATSAIAIKAYTMEILYRLSVLYPQLANELAVSVRVLMEEGSAGIVARGNAVLKKITEIPLNQGSSQKLF